MDPDEEPTADQIVAAFRSRREEAAREAAAQGGAPGAPGPAPEPSPSPSAVPTPRPVQPSHFQPQPPSQPLPPPQSLQPFSPPADASPALRPIVPAGVALTPGSPGLIGLNLSSRLLEDRFVARSGNRTGVAAGVALALLGLAAVVADQALLSRGVTVAPLNTDLTSIGVALAAIGLAVAIPFLFLPRRRSLRVRLAATQQEEWARVKAEAERLRKRSVAGAATALGGLAGAALSYAFVAQPEGGYLAGLLALAALAGTALLAWAASRRGLLQRLYVQTLVLSRLEQTGLGPAAEADPRIAPVLRSLDRLLGALPESAVRRFLASDEAAQYLELIDDLSKDRRHGP